MNRYTVGSRVEDDGEFVHYVDHKAEVEAMLGVCKTYQKDRDEANAARDMLVAQNKTLADALEEMKREHTKVFDEMDTVRRERNGLYNDLGDVKRSLTETDNDLRGVTKERDFLKGQLEVLTGIEKHLLRQNTTLRRLAEAIAGGDGDAQIMDGYLTMLNKRIGNYTTPNAADQAREASPGTPGSALEVKR